MQISTQLSYAGGFVEAAAQVAEMERAGLDMVWAAEVYGFDAVSYLGYLAAKTERVQLASGILPIFTRTPTLLAMTAAGLDALSGGRFQLGLGASGPQVIEGWHGVPYDAPLARTREIVDICRQVWTREAPLEHNGHNYELPLAPQRGTGLGKPLKMLAHPIRTRIPVWLAAIGEKNVALTAEVAEGWLPIFFLPEKAKEVWGASLEAGLAKRDPAAGPLEIAAGGFFAVGEGDEVLALRDLARPQLALYIGGMGARGKNFYNSLACRYGFDEAAARIQDYYLDGKKEEAAAAIPDELLASVTLIGARSFVAERIALLRESGVTNLMVSPLPTRDQTTSELIELARDLAS